MDNENPYVFIETNKGLMKVELFFNDAPETVRNFINLVEKGFYNGLTFHRVIDGFIIQGGCPNGNGTGGPGYTIKCETERNPGKHLRGSLSMAHTGKKDTGGSQFFICLSPQEHLDGKHTVFGCVVDGFDVIDAITAGDRMKYLTVLKKVNNTVVNRENPPSEIKRQEQKPFYLLSIMSGFILAVIAAFIWAGAAIILNKVYSILGAGIGYCIGSTMALCSRKTDIIIQIMAIIFTIGSIITGNTIYYYDVLSQEGVITFFDVLLNYHLIVVADPFSFIFSMGCALLGIAYCIKTMKN